MFLNSLNIAGSGMTAQRLRMDIISQNLSNADTTGSSSGETYRRKVVTLAERTQTDYTGSTETEQSAGGVEVSSIEDDTSSFKEVYDPDNKAANAKGYVEYPNVDTTTEMVDMMSASRSYQADVTAFNALKGMAVNALQIGK